MHYTRKKGKILSVIHKAYIVTYIHTYMIYLITQVTNEIGETKVLMWTCTIQVISKWTNYV